MKKKKRVLPPVKTRKLLDDMYAVLNKRRCDLIDRDIYKDDLSDAEKSELELLQDIAARYVHLVAPLPTRKLRAMERRVEKLLKEKEDAA